VTEVISNRALVIHAAFSADFVSTTEIYVRKDAEQLRRETTMEAEKKRNREGDDDDDDLPLNERFQKRIESRLKKQSELFTYQERTG
jgi:hypothetical protein